MLSHLYFGVEGAVRMHREANLMDLWPLLTCIIDSVPHLKTADGAGFVCGVTTEDQLKCTCTCQSLVDTSSSYRGARTDLPGLDLPPQVFKLLQVQLSGAVGLRQLMGKSSSSK